MKIRISNGDNKGATAHDGQTSKTEGAKTTKVDMTEAEIEAHCEAMNTEAAAMGLKTRYEVSAEEAEA